MCLTPGPFVSVRASDLLPEHTHHTLGHTANVLDARAHTTNCLPARVMDPPNPTNVDLQGHNGATPLPPERKQRGKIRLRSPKNLRQSLRILA